MPKAPAKKPPAKAPAKAPPKAPPKRGTSVERKGDRKRIDSVAWPVSEDGIPMVQISFTASELIPTGEYANVTIGPVTVTKFVSDGDDDHLAGELNHLAELVESDCIAEQREIVIESIQSSKK